jgi:uncharacterized protein involved in cysteine biosynthesis
MQVLPCPLCGYDAPDALVRGCPHCRLAPLEPTLRRPRAGPIAGIWTGLAALPRGLVILATTRGVKRWLVPPFVLTLGAFALLFWWLWRWVNHVIDAIRSSTPASLPWGEGWLRDATEWVLRSGALAWLANLGGFLVVLVVGFVAALWAFSIVYEALSGPFLDEVHGRLEERWFGSNPRDALSRPTALSPSRCGALTALAAIPALGAVVAWWFLEGWPAWLVLVLGVPLPFLALSLAKREYGRWLAWAIGIEAETLWVSVKASLIAGAVLVLFFPLKFVPVVGYVMFGCVAGFCTALSLLDIPLSRRQWKLRARLAFLARHAPAMIAFGVLSSLLFVVPVIGPALMVPAASVGGLWLICRLDKDFLRPAEQRLGRRAPAVAAVKTWEGARDVEVEEMRREGLPPAGRV